MPKAFPFNRKISAIDRNGREYTSEEMYEVFCLLYSKSIKAVRLMFPSMSLNTIYNRANKYGIAKKDTTSRWKSAEDAIIRKMRPNHGFPEIAALLPGRTLRSVEGRARKLKLPNNPFRSPWTEEEEAQLRRGEAVPTRSKQAATHRRVALGINRRLQRQARALGEAELLRRIGEHVHHGHEKSRRADIIYTVNLLCLEGRCSTSNAALAAAVKKATTAVYKLHPDRGAPVSLDAKAFDDGSETIGDRISSDRFHF